VFTDPIEYLSVSTRENLLHPKLQGVGLQFILCLKKKRRQIIVIVHGEAKLHHFRKWQIIVIPSNYVFRHFHHYDKLSSFFVSVVIFSTPMRYNRSRINCQNKCVYLLFHFIWVTNFYSYDMQGSGKIKA
jgi:hypothetical protein